MNRWKMLTLLLPLTELLFLLFLSKNIGVMNTVFVIILAGLLGMVLVKRQGVQTLRNASQQMRNGQIPGPEIVNGICIIIGAILLIIPGVISDIFSLIFLIPWTRKLMKPLLFYWINKMVSKGKFVVTNRFYY